ncbi:MAG: HAMP domain-containing histidine kinase, partial [Actinobacteria bacterium]|nr:HAMP domain-containing histidine kinase [Actinomycetota bacterium]
GAWEPRWDWHDVEDLLETAVLSVSLSDRGRIATSPPDDPVTAYVDFEQVVRALQSLLENAVVYAGADVPVRIGADAAPGMLRLWVEDEGPGIPEQERDRVFEKFYRTPEGAKVPSGTGLGLAITREIVTAHGGEVRVEDVVPHGARFVVELPQPPSDAEVGPGRREKP